MKPITIVSIVILALIVGFAGFALLTSFGAGISMIGMVTYKTGASYTLTVIPLFILMGLFSNFSRMGYDLYQTVYRWIGFLPGGLAMATVVACAGFAAISGSSYFAGYIVDPPVSTDNLSFNQAKSPSGACRASFPLEGEIPGAEKYGQCHLPFCPGHWWIVYWLVFAHRSRGGGRIWSVCYCRD